MILAKIFTFLSLIVYCVYSRHMNEVETKHSHRVREPGSYDEDEFYDHNIAQSSNQNDIETKHNLVLDLLEYFYGWSVKYLNGKYPKDIKKNLEEKSHLSSFEEKDENKENIYNQNTSDMLKKEKLDIESEIYTDKNRETEISDAKYSNEYETGYHLTDKIEHLNISEENNLLHNQYLDNMYHTNEEKYKDFTPKINIINPKLDENEEKYGHTDFYKFKENDMSYSTEAETTNQDENTDNFETTETDSLLQDYEDDDNDEDDYSDENDDSFKHEEETKINKDMFEISGNTYNKSFDSDLKNKSLRVPQNQEKTDLKTKFEYDIPIMVSTKMPLRDLSIQNKSIFQLPDNEIKVQSSLKVFKTDYENTEISGNMRKKMQDFDEKKQKMYTPRKSNHDILEKENQEVNSFFDATKRKKQLRSSKI